jgi:hypothetical protein
MDCFWSDGYAGRQKGNIGKHEDQIIIQIINVQCSLLEKRKRIGSYHPLRNAMSRELRTPTITNRIMPSSDTHQHCLPLP